MDLLYCPHTHEQQGHRVRWPFRPLTCIHSYYLLRLALSSLATVLSPIDNPYPSIHLTSRLSSNKAPCFRKHQQLTVQLPGGPGDQMHSSLSRSMSKRKCIPNGLGFALTIARPIFQHLLFSSAA